MFKNVRRLGCLVAMFVMLTCATALLAACGGGGSGNGSKPVGSIDQTTISYDGSIFEWDAASNATKYTLTINGNTYSTSAPRYSYPISVFNADQIVFTIKAQNDSSESEEVTKTFYRLETIKTDAIVFDEFGRMSWTGVMGATEYLVEINGVTHTVVSTEYSDFSAGERNVIRIRAVGSDNSYFSVWSDSISKTYLSEPTNVTYDGQFIKWQGAAGAVNYSVYINDSLYQTTNSTSLLYDSNQANFTVAVRANGDGRSVFSSKNSESQQFIFLGQVTNIRVEEGVLVWDPVEGAVAYEVQVQNRGTTKVEVTRFSLVSGMTQIIKIKPVAPAGSVFFSDWSEERSFYILPAPSLQWDDTLTANQLHWNAVDGSVTGYNIRIKLPNGEVINDFTSATKPDYDYGFTTVGEYTVSVQTVATVNTDFENSLFSDPITVIRLNRPDEYSLNITSNSQDISDGFRATFSAISGATAYRLYKNFEQTPLTSTTSSIHVTQLIDENVTTEQKLHYGIQSVGSALRPVGTTKVVTLDSIDQLEFDITVLAMPTNVDIQGYRVNWDMVSDAPGYAVNYGTLVNADNPYFDLTAITAAANYDFRICSRGNGRNVLPSNYTPVIKLTKLAAPTNIRVGTDVNEGTLSWDPVTGNHSYNVYFDGQDTPVVADQIDNINSYITVDTVTVVVQTIANYWSDESHSTYIITSNLSETRRFTKLSAVQFAKPAFSNNELIWSPPANVSGANITYKVYDETGSAYDGQINGPRMNISMLEGGRSYTFAVKCIGDGREFINSELSEPISVLKLETPTVTRSRTAYQWSGIPGAISYAVWVDGVLASTISHDYNKTVYEYIPSFQSIKDYTVTVTAIGDNGFESIDSNPCVITQKITQLVTPSIDFSYDHECYDVNGNIVINVLSDNPNASGYRYYIDGTIVQSKTEEKTFKYNVRSHGEYIVSVVALGGTFDDSGIYYYDSKPAGGNDQYKITLLDVPNVSTITINKSGLINWTPVTNAANGYELIITYKDGSTETATATVAQYIPKEGNAADITSIQIRVMGNGKTTITSEYVTWRR